MLREARGLSQAALAKLCGVTPGAVSQWELGSTENIKLEPFLRLCDALVVTPHYLVFGPARSQSQAANNAE